MVLLFAIYIDLDTTVGYIWRYKMSFEHLSIYNVQQKGANMATDVYTVGDLQRKYGLSRSGAYAYVHTLPPDLVLRFGKSIRIDKLGLMKYLAEQKTGSAPSPNSTLPIHPSSSK